MYIPEFVEETKFDLNKVLFSVSSSAEDHMLYLFYALYVDSEPWINCCKTVRIGRNSTTIRYRNGDLRLTSGCDCGGFIRSAVTDLIVANSIDDNSTSANSTDEDDD